MIKDVLLKGKERVETRLPKRTDECFSSSSSFLKLFRLTYLLALVHIIGINRVGETFNNCHESKQRFLLEIPKKISRRPHDIDEMPYSCGFREENRFHYWHIDLIRKLGKDVQKQI